MLCSAAQQSATGSFLTLSSKAKRRRRFISRSFSTPLRSDWNVAPKVFLTMLWEDCRATSFFGEKLPCNVGAELLQVLNYNALRVLVAL